MFMTTDFPISPILPLTGPGFPDRKILSTEIKRSTIKVDGRWNTPRNPVRHHNRGQIEPKTFSEIFNRWRALPGRSSEHTVEHRHADCYREEVYERTESEFEETNEDDKKGYYPIWRHSVLIF